MQTSRQKERCRWAILLTCALSPLAFSQEPSGSEIPSNWRGHDLGTTADGITGLVINQTLSAKGYDFYRLFYILWTEKRESENYSLSVEERLSKRYGNQVRISLGQRSVFVAFLPQKIDQLNALCEKAVEDTLSNIVTIALEGSSEDMVKGEM